MYWIRYPLDNVRPAEGSLCGSDVDTNSIMGSEMCVYVCVFVSVMPSKNTEHKKCKLIIVIGEVVWTFSPFIQKIC